jgi:hypothetical protein
MIKPSIGRVVWFHPSITDHSLASGGDQPLAALVSHVWSDTCVNLAVFDANGKPHGKTSVLLLQDDAIAPEGGYYAEWMPFQKGQAAKHEAPAPVTEEQRIDATIVKAGKTAPRITSAHIDSLIIDRLFFTAYEASIGQDVSPQERPLVAMQAHGLLTFCVLTLRNGFTVTGESACASPENFDAGIGRDIAFKNAREKVWLLEGYLLRERLFQMTQTAQLPE